MAAVASLPADLRNELNDLLLAFDGLERARYLAIAGLCCMVYDIAVTFDQEVEYFWQGPWDLSRILFFLNRYFPPVVLVMGLIGFLGHMSVADCTRVIHATFLMTVFGVFIVQAIIVLRICYVYSKNLVARAVIVGTLAISTVCAIVLLGMLWHDIDAMAVNVPGLKITNCTAPTSRELWKLFVPNIAIHTVLFLATTIPALRMRRLGKKSMLMNRLVMDGGLFYFVVFVVAMFSAIGALAKTPLVTIPAIYSNLWLAMSSISVSRLMLGIRTLAARLSLEPDWLLNNTELSRVNWKRGARSGELIVEVDAIEIEDVEMDAVGDDDDPPTTFKRSHTPVIHVSRVGVLDHPVYPGTRGYRAPPRMKRQKVAFDCEPPAYAR